MILRSFLVLFSLIGGLFATVGNAVVNSQHIQTRVTQFLETQRPSLSAQYGSNASIAFSINDLDPRLSMADCPQSLVVERKSDKFVGRVNLKVSCQTEARWSIYVPVDIQVSIPVVTVISPVARGEQLNRAMMQLQARDISRINGTYYTRIEDIEGMQAKRPLKPNQPIFATQLQPPLVIKKGESVLVSANSGPLSVKISGVALMDGHLGQQISVRNSKSKRVVEGKVIAPGQVQVAM